MFTFSKNPVPMKNILILFLGFSLPASGQSLFIHGNPFLENRNVDWNRVMKNEKNGYPDSSYYWINTDYYKCLQSSSSVCNCLSQNEIVMMFIDFEKSEALVQSSIFHFGLEQSDKYDLIRQEDGARFIATNGWRYDTISIQIKDENQAYISYHDQMVNFRRENFKTLHIPKTSKAIFSQVIDMSDQLGALNSMSVLGYVTDSISGTKDTIIQFDSLKQLIEEKAVSIYCSQDFQYNEMVIRTDPVRYFYLEYGENELILYDEVRGRDLEEPVNPELMKSQILFRK